MPRGKAKGKERLPEALEMIPVGDEVKGLSEIESKYGDRTDGIIRLGVVTELKKKENQGVGVGELLARLSVEQVCYLNMRAEGLSSAYICRQLGISRASVLLWEEESELFKTCVNVIKRLEADDAEEYLWSRIKSDPKANIERMYGLKARKPEYREDTNNTGLNQTKIEINVAGKPFDVSQSVKLVGSDS